MSQPHKIVIDARRIRTSTGRYVHELIKHLDVIDNDNEYHVIIHQKDQGTWAPSTKNFFMHVVPYDHYTFGEQLGFARFLRSLKPDLVHFSMPQQPLLYFGKRITTVHDLTLVNFQNIDQNKLIYLIKQRIFIFLLKNVVKRSQMVITPTKYVRDELRNYVKTKPDKIVYTHEAVDHFHKAKVTPVPELVGKDFIMFLGNAYPYKNLQRLVDAFAVIKQDYPKLHLALAGKKEYFYEKLEDHVAESGIPDVHFLDFVSDEEAAWLYKHAKLYVFPSLSEGFGLPGLEAMVYGTPVLAARATCLPEVYGEAARYFDPLDIEDMAASIEEFIGNKTKRETLAKRGLKQQQKYSWNKMAKKTHAIYQKVLGVE